jgi:pimeloyl-ACP methyl ester carboxylesterase
MLASPGIPGNELLDLRTPALMKASGAGDEFIAQTRWLQNLIFAFLKEETPNAQTVEKVRAEGSRIIAEMPEDQKERMNGYLNLMLTRPAWYRYFVTYDPRRALRRLRIPVLAVNGERDLQAPPKENLSAIAEALKAGGNKNYKTVELPQLNHHLQTSQTGAPDEYGQIEETISPLALELVADWILKRTVKR